MIEVSTSVAEVLSTLADEGVESSREQLILWLIRNQYGVGVEDSYASVLSDTAIFPGADVDAIVVTTRRDLVSPVYVVFDDSWSAVANRVAALIRALRTVEAPEAKLAATNSQLRSLIEPATDRKVSGDISRLILGVSPTEARPRDRNRLTGMASEVADVEVIDLRFIDALAQADADPTSTMPTVAVKVDPETILNLGMVTASGIITPVPADQIARWEGITDRRLFDLNVRYALGLNRVRRSLDAALRNADEADEFIAYHNGITAICSDFRITRDGIEIDGLSVVNGAQTVVAIHANQKYLAPGVRLMFKLIKARPDSELASNIAVRSNTQNPVTSRNLRALDEVQARLEAQLGALGYVYTRRPSDREPAGDRVIHNDDAAQLLCSVYARKPALAVKRQVLFEEPLYGEVFPSDLDAARVVFAAILRQRVEAQKSNVPAVYQKAWALTALTLVHMAAESMRSDPYGGEVLLNPGPLITDRDRVADLIDPFVEAACEVLRERAEMLAADPDGDDFKVDFKQARTLSELALRSSQWHRRHARR